jgi:Cof subfamily protein (haloacid dehalogenase superfamily)
MRIRLIAADLDGTLMGESLRFSTRVRAVLRQVKAQGVKFTIATGRIFAEALPFARQLDITAPLVCSQGGYIRALDSPDPLYEATMPLGLAREAIRLSRRAAWHLHIYVDDVAYVERPWRSEEEYRRLLGMEVRRVPDLLAFLCQSPAKFLIITDEAEEATELDEELRARFADQLRIVRSHRTLVEGNPLEASKGQGLARLAARLGISQQAIMAIGDQDNDADIVAWAGLGVAMGNASPGVKAVADYVAPPVEEDGAAEAIERFVLS